MRGRRAAATAVVLMLIAVACGDDADAGVVVEGVWARATAPSQTSGAVYMQLSSADGDALIGVDVADSIAGSIAMHETSMEDMHEDMDDDMHEGMTDEEAESMTMTMTMTMLPVSEISVPAGKSVALEPGGFHVMMTDLVEPLVAGQVFDLTLQFEGGGDVVVEVEVREDAP
jgi:copper(I)-binding protein